MGGGVDLVVSINVKQRHMSKWSDADLSHFPVRNVSFILPVFRIVCFTCLLDVTLSVSCKMSLVNLLEIGLR